MQKTVKQIEPIHDVEGVGIVICFEHQMEARLREPEDFAFISKPTRVTTDGIRPAQTIQIQMSSQQSFALSFSGIKIVISDPNRSICSEGLQVTQKDVQPFIDYFDDLEQKIKFLVYLSNEGFKHEALTLCLVYIDGLAQRLCWPDRKNGVNFVRALTQYADDPEIGMIHPKQLCEELRSLKRVPRTIPMIIRTIFPGPKYELLTEPIFFNLIGTHLNPTQLNILRKEIWRGTIAAVAYYRLRIPAVHELGASPLSFDKTTYAGQPAQPLDLPRLQRAALRLQLEARRRSIAKGQWFGDNRMLQCC